MSKRLSALLCPALLTILALFILTSCGDKADVKPEPFDFSSCTVVRSDTSSDEVTDAALQIRRALADAGCESAIATDYGIEGGANMILVGDTGLYAPPALERYDFSITRTGDYIVIAGGSDIAVGRAAQYFAENLANIIADGCPEGYEYMSTFEITDNSALIPAIKPEDEVTLISCESGGEALTPDWATTLIMAEVHIETATAEGTLEAAVSVLDHCAETGINGIWVTPIYEKGEGGNGYGNLGPHTVESALTGTDDIEKSWAAVKSFVDEAHKRNIRVILDIITWGTMPTSDLYINHSDWYDGEAWGNKAFNWKNEEFVDWFVNTAYENIMKTGADGYRCDCEPNYAGYDVFSRIRRLCLDAGRKILIIAEDGCERAGAFDMEQDGVLSYKGWSRGEQYQTPKSFYLGELDIVDSIALGDGIGSQKLQNRRSGGQYRFYTYCVSNHDYQYSITNKNRLVMGYQAIFSPYIPLWYLGAEIGMEAQAQVIYFVPVDWSLMDNAENAMFYEDIKRYIKIRRSYPEIFEYFPEDHRDANIVRVETSADTGVTAYARYADGKAIIIVPNSTDSALTLSVTIPSGIGVGSVGEVTNLLTGEKTAVSGGAFEVTVAPSHMAVFIAD
ncbi:MAG: alpha-amylase family glycosyl hydrolase [Eubacteriales bacterium]